MYYEIMSKHDYPRSKSAFLAEYDVGYLPKPNILETMPGRTLAPLHLTPTAFVVPMLSSDSCMLVVHKDPLRGVGIPGGHVDPGETLVQAATREALEETGCTVDNLIPVGFLRSQIGGQPPDGYHYPFPLSYQQFFVGRVVRCSDFEADQEVSHRLHCTIAEAMTHLRRQRDQIMLIAAAVAYAQMGGRVIPA